MRLIISIDKSNIDQFDRFLHLMKATGTSEALDATVVPSPKVRAKVDEKAEELSVVFKSVEFGESYGSYEDSSIRGRNRQFYHCIAAAIPHQAPFIIVDASCIPLRRDWSEILEEQWREAGQPLAMLHADGDFHKHVGIYSERFYSRFKFWSGYFGEQLWNQIGRFQLQADTIDSGLIVDGSILDAVEQDGIITGQISEVAIHLPKGACLAYNSSDSLAELSAELLGQPVPEPGPTLSQLEQAAQMLRGAGYTVFAPSNETSINEDESPAERLQDIIDEDKKIIDIPVETDTVTVEEPSPEPEPIIEELPKVRRRRKKASE